MEAELHQNDAKLWVHVRHTLEKNSCSKTWNCYDTPVRTANKLSTLLGWSQKARTGTWNRSLNKNGGVEEHVVAEWASLKVFVHRKTKSGVFVSLIAFWMLSQYGIAIWYRLDMNVLILLEEKGCFFTFNANSAVLTNQNRQNVNRQGCVCSIENNMKVYPDALWAENRFSNVSRATTVMLLIVKWQYDLVNIDNVAIILKTREGLLHNIEDILMLLSKAGVMINLIKCSFLVKPSSNLATLLHWITYLGGIRSGLPICRMS